MTGQQTYETYREVQASLSHRRTEYQDWKDLPLATKESWTAVADTTNALKRRNTP